MTKQTKKAKKPLQTTLGKAPGQNEKEEVDLSHMKQPIETSVHGLPQVVSLMQKATEEVKGYLTYECDVMYECRICRTIFRSLASFILHKRSFCKEKYKPVVSNCGDRYLLDILNHPEPPEGEAVHNVATPGCSTWDRESPQLEKVSPLEEKKRSLLERRSSSAGPTEEKTNPSVTRSSVVTRSTSVEKTGSQPSTSKGLGQVIEKLVKKQEIHQMMQELVTVDLSKDNEEESAPVVFTSNDIEMSFESMAGESVAVFQNLHSASVKEQPESMKTQVMELHDILNRDGAVLGRDGKICNVETNNLKSLGANPDMPRNDFTCPQCQMKFSTRKTLIFHIKQKHNNSRIVFVCPECKETFANAWCVYRHLNKIHRKTLTQAKKLRERIHNGMIRKDQHTIKNGNKKAPSKLDTADEENQWLNNIELDADLQMCGGCGKKFDRKAALQSHGAMCSRRIALCNSIKENKKKDEDSKNIKHKISHVVKSDKPRSPDSTLCLVLKGASKRKPYLLRTYKQRDRKPVRSLKSNSVDDEPVPCDSNSSSLNSCDVKVTLNHNSDSCDSINTLAICDRVKTRRNSCDRNVRTRKMIACDEDLRRARRDKEHKRNICDKDCAGVQNHKREVCDGNEGDVIILDCDDSSENSCDKPEVVKEERSLENERLVSIASIGTEKILNILGTPVAGIVPTDVIEIIDEDASSPKSEPEVKSTENFVHLCEAFIQSMNSGLKESQDLDLDRKTEKNNEIAKKNTRIPCVFTYNSDCARTNEPEQSPEDSILKKSLENHADVHNVDGMQNCLKEEEPEVSPQKDKFDDSGSLGSIQGKVRLRKLEELRGFPKEPDEPCNSFKHMPLVEPRPSPKRTKKKSPVKLVKRRPVLDESRKRKNFKHPKLDVLLDKQPLKLMAKASPYMDRSTLTCKSCKLIFDSLPKLLWHMSAHFNWFRFQCRSCSFVSFGKTECSTHAINKHEIKNSEISSIVLPIPDWKIQMMATEFTELDNENEFGGKLTDEVKPCFDNENSSSDNNEPTTPSNQVGIFDDIESDCVDFENTIEPFPLPKLDDQCYVKSECIDVNNDENDRFQLEVPQEIYNSDPFVQTVEDERDSQPRIKEEIEDLGFGTVNCAITSEFPEDRSLKVASSNSINNRPTRNRVRSIKTLQNDFFYDMSKVSKQSDGFSKTNGPQKLKKPASNLQKKDKEMRVYAKNK